MGYFCCILCLKSYEIQIEGHIGVPLRQLLCVLIFLAEKYHKSCVELLAYGYGVTGAEEGVLWGTRPFTNLMYS